jgi:hypothetical protein
VNQGSDPARDDEAGMPTKKLDRKTLFIAVVLIVGLALLIAFNMN